jgi:hypothetical protein
MMSSASAAADATSRAADSARRAAIASAKAAADAAAKAAEAARKAAIATAKAAEEKVASGAHAAYEGAAKGGAAIAHGAAAVGKGVANVATFGARATGEAIASAVDSPYLAAKKLFSPKQTPRQSLIEPCPTTEAGKRKRLEERQNLIAIGRRPDASPAAMAAANRLDRNNQAVELARLSDDAYAQYGDPPVNNPPIGWSRVSDEELKEKGVDPGLLKGSKAVIYRTPADWPGGQKTVLAFRGTADKEDAIVDHDQALAVPTAQYKDAALLGSRVSKAYGSDVLVTGHSLGGGKAQAAGTMGGLHGTMFNSAGLNPDTLGGQMPSSDQFVQYRTSHDPLTGIQNSPLTQTATAGVVGILATPLGVGMKIGDAAQKALGLPGLSPEMAGYADRAAKALPRAMRNLWNDGSVMPPAAGKIEEVPAINDHGQTVAPYDPLGQHSIKSVVNGIEEQKSEDVATLRGS